MFWTIFTQDKVIHLDGNIFVFKSGRKYIVDSKSENFPNNNCINFLKKLTNPRDFIKKISGILGFSWSTNTPVFD